MYESRKENIERTGIKIRKIDGGYEAEAFREKGMPYRSADGAKWYGVRGARLSAKLIDELRAAFSVQVQPSGAREPQSSPMSHGGVRMEPVRGLAHVCLDRRVDRGGWKLSLVGRFGFDRMGVFGLGAMAIAQTPGEDVGSTAELTDDQVQLLADQLWLSGVRPSSSVASARDQPDHKSEPDPEPEPGAVDGGGRTGEGDLRAHQVWLEPSDVVGQDWDLRIGVLESPGYIEIAGLDGSRREYRTDRDNAVTVVLDASLVKRLVGQAWDQGVVPSKCNHVEPLVLEKGVPMEFGEMIAGPVDRAGELLAAKDAHIADLQKQVEGLTIHNAELAAHGRAIEEAYSVLARSLAAKMPLPSDRPKTDEPMPPMATSQIGGGP